MNNNLIDYIDADEGRDSVVSNCCYNCEAKAAEGTWLSEFTTTEGLDVWACDACIAEAARLDSEADRLAALPSCPERLRIIDRAATVRQLVNLLAAHDQGICLECAVAATVVFACVECASTRKTVQSDREHLSPAAVCCETAVA